MAQAGIYTVGQFAKHQKIVKKKKLASIILFKDLTVQIALATLDPALANEENSIGVMYQIVDSLHGYKLNNPVDLSRFSSVFIAALKSTLD